jgi:hypothetical protein
MKNILLVILIFSSELFSQELNCKVDVNFESLPVNNRELLADFGAVVESYMNTTRFTNEDWGMKIDCTISIFFISAGSDVDYSAQMVVVSQRPIFQSTNNSPMLTVNDGQWQFKYQKGQAMYPNQTTFDPLTSFLDFYAMIIIGMDSDSFEEFGGTPYFKRAQDIVNLGNSSSSNFGWQSSSSVYSRWGLVNDILSEKYAMFRSAIFDYHQYGIDSFNRNKETAYQNIKHLVDVLWEMYEKTGSINSVYVRTFFDAKNGEIIEYLKSKPDSELFNRLKKIDPPHSSKYESVMP